MNSNIPYPFGWLTGYLAILLGAGLTILVQSSSVFTSTMTPLVGSGILHIKRMYPLTLGSNIGTTFTAILAALAIAGDGFERSMQVALCHFFFNIISVIVWYPFPAMRKIPIALAKGKYIKAFWYGNLKKDKIIGASGNTEAAALAHNWPPLYLVNHIMLYVYYICCKLETH